MGIHLLWTGGWDSTFRLLDLAITRKSVPQTHYLFDETRASRFKELETMGLIRCRLADLGIQMPEPRVVKVSELPRDEVAEQRFMLLRERDSLGSQYLWLNTYAQQLGAKLELSVHVDDRAAKFLEPYAEFNDYEPGGIWKLKANVPDEMELFRTFLFPILALTKVDMQLRAKAAGFDDLLELTWFCHKPLRGQPCGVCDPCRFTIDEGLARRVPLVNRLTALVRLPIRQAKKSLRAGRA